MKLFSAMKIKDAGESGIIDMEDCDISAFKEVLYQVLPYEYYNYFSPHNNLFCPLWK